MKTKLTIFFLLSFVFIGKAQCWNDLLNSEFYFTRDDGSLWSYTMPQSELVQPYQVNNATGWMEYLGIGCILKSDGTVWGGTNFSNQISQGWRKIINANYNSPFKGIKLDGTLWSINTNFSSTQIGLDSDWQEIKSTGVSTIAKKTNGTLWSWGSNTYGQCGVGSNIDISVPTQIGNSLWKDFFIKSRYGIAIKEDGTLWSWGTNTYGQCGTGGLLNTNIPTQIGSSNNWKTIKAYNGLVYAIKTDGTLWSWGKNYLNSLGYTTVDPYQIVSTPTQIGTDTDWDNFDSNIAQKNDGSYWLWGGSGVSVVSLISYGDYLFPTPRQIVPPGYQKIVCDPADDSENNGGPSYYKILALKDNNRLYIKGFWAFSNGANNPPSYMVNQYPRFIYCDPADPELLNINQTSQKEISVFPNPVTDILNMQIEDQLNNAEIFDLGGRLLHTEKIINNQLNMSQLQRGIYFVKINGTDKVYSIKISKE